MTQTVLLGTRSATQGVGVSVADPWTMFSYKVVLLHLLKPPRLLSYWIWSFFEPRQSGVIRADAELTAQQVLFEIAKEMDDCQEFLACYAIISLSLI